MNHYYENVPEECKQESHQDAVARYLAGAELLGASVQGLSHDQLNQFPVPGTWSIQQIVFHMFDTDQAASYRMKRIIAEKDPVIDSYDENAFSTDLRCSSLDAHMACEAFALNRKLTAAMLRELPDEMFERAASHPEFGSMTLGLFVRVYANHLHHHMPFVEKKRSMV